MLEIVDSIQESGTGARLSRELVKAPAFSRPNEAPLLSSMCFLLRASKRRSNAPLEAESRIDKPSNMASWLGYATTTWTHHPCPITLPLKHTGDNTSSTTTNGRTLVDLCKASTPPCDLTPLLPGGHTQTIYAATYKKPIALLNYKRRIFTSNNTTYPGCFAVDFVSRDSTDQDVETVNPRTTLFKEGDWERYMKTGSVDVEAEEGEVNKRPIIVALHGISGGSHELYLRQVLDPLVTGAPTAAGGGVGPAWDALVVNSRGCANSPVTGSQLFNARATWDIRQFLEWLREKFPHRQLFAVGFSLGANILVNVRRVFLSVGGWKIAMRVYFTSLEPRG